MRWLLLCLLAASCEKVAPTATSSGSGSGVQITGVARDVRPPVIATMPTDAAVAAAAPDAAVPVDAAAVGRAARDAAALKAMEADALAFADLLTADTGGPSYDMTKRRPGADLGAQIADVRDRGVAIGGGTGRGGDADRGGGTARVGEQAVDDSGLPRGRISVTAKQSAGDTTLTADIALAKIQAAYMAGLKRCYKAELAKDPAIQGPLTLVFSVQETGRTFGATATSFTADLGRCVGGMMASWRFPVPKDKDGEPTTAQLTITLKLTPD